MDLNDESKHGMRQTLTNASLILINIIFVAPLTEKMLKNVDVSNFIEGPNCFSIYQYASVLLVILFISVVLYALGLWLLYRLKLSTKNVLIVMLILYVNASGIALSDVIEISEQSSHDCRGT